MKILATMAVALLFGCSQGPDFSEPAKVVRKSTSHGVTTYEIDNDHGVRGAGWGTVKFNAPVGFAEVGDTIVFKNGVLLAESN